MSEQGQSNVQALAAGLFGFLAVMGIGGGALLVHSSRGTKAGAAPAAEPVDLILASPISVPVMFAPPDRPVASEARAESPAPLRGEEGDNETSSPAAAAAPGLVVSGHLDAQGGGSSAVAVVENTAAPREPEAITAAAVPSKADSKTAAAAVAAVHYGVTDRRELMGRAAGPVNNFKGAGRAGSVAAGRMADEVNARIADLRRQLDRADMPADQRARLLRDIEEAKKIGDGVRYQ